jgi:hypothetical protein
MWSFFLLACGVFLALKKVSVKVIYLQKTSIAGLGFMQYFILAHTVHFGGSAAPNFSFETIPCAIPIE